MPDMPEKRPTGFDAGAFDAIASRLDAIVAEAPADQRAALRFHLEHLAFAVARGRPEVFARTLAWADRAETPPASRPRDLLAGLEPALDAHLPPDLAARCRRALHAALDRPPPPATEPAAPPLNDLARACLDDLLAGRRDLARNRILAAVAGGLPVRDVYSTVFEPVQIEVGRRWQLGRLSVAQEHYCTAAIQLAMASLYPYVFGAASRGRRVLAATIGGELHEIGARMVADLFTLAGWEVDYLGADLPAFALVAAVRELRPQVVALSTTLRPHVRRVMEAVAALRRESPRPIVLVGGQPFREDPELAIAVGADGTAPDAASAVACAERLLAGREPAGVAAAPVEPLILPPDAAEPLLQQMSHLNNELLGAQRELHRQNEVLRRLDREKNELLGMVAHDVRNPLRIISGLCDVLLEEDQPPDEQRRTIQGIDALVGRLGRLVSELVDVSAIEAGHVRLEKRRFDLADRLRRDVELSRALAARKQVRVDLEAPAAGLPIEADPDKIDQVILNLVQNAIKFSPPGGRVAVRLVRDQDEARVTVIDQGPGMAPEARACVFRTYVHRSARGTAGEAGTGLGLLISGRIVERHGGRCWVESEPGAGATVGFALPA
jgi:signal transduction histidine kinase